MSSQTLEEKSEDKMSSQTLEEKYAELEDLKKRILLSKDVCVNMVEDILPNLLKEHDFIYAIKHFVRFIMKFYSETESDEQQTDEIEEYKLCEKGVKSVIKKIIEKYSDNKDLPEGLSPITKKYSLELNG